MITFSTRKEIVTNKKLISSELTKMQKAFFDAETLQSYKDDNEEHLYWEQFDCFNNEVIEIETQSRVIGLSNPDIDTLTAELCSKLTELFQVMNVEEIILISHLKLDFFGNRNNQFEPLVKAYSKLEKIVGQSTYKEAFTFGLDGLSDFIEILFWLTRCDTNVSEYMYIFDKNEQIQLYICKYGNIHVTAFGNTKLIDERLTSLGWVLIDGEEFDRFEDKISGRQIRI